VSCTRTVVALLFVATVAAAVSADYQALFRTGVTAYQKGRHQEAVTALAQAIAERPNESTTQVFLYGVNYEPYVPHYFLGMAYSKLGNCAEAVRALTESRRQNVVPKRYSKDIEPILARCGPASAPPTATVREEPAPPRPEPQPPVTTTTAPPPITVPPVTNTQPPATNTVAPAPAPGPRADNRLPAVRQALNTTLQKSRRLLASVPKDVSASESQTLRTRIKRAESLMSSQSVDDISTITSDLADATKDLETWLRLRGSDVPRELVAGVEAYLRGDYAASVSALEGAMYSDQRLLAQAMLFRAAALHALFVIGHSKDRSLMSRATRDVQQFKRLQRNALINARVFNPTFVEFVEQTGS
jgi:tetratricopeptide (TPR) repeat protein